MCSIPTALELISNFQPFVECDDLNRPTSQALSDAIDVYGLQHTRVQAFSYIASSLSVLPPTALCSCFTAMSTSDLTTLFPSAACATSELLPQMGLTSQTCGRLALSGSDSCSCPELIQTTSTPSTPPTPPPTLPAGANIFMGSESDGEYVLARHSALVSIVVLLAVGAIGYFGFMIATGRHKIESNEVQTKRAPVTGQPDAEDSLQQEDLPITDGSKMSEQRDLESGAYVEVEADSSPDTDVNDSSNDAEVENEEHRGDAEVESEQNHGDNNNETGESFGFNTEDGEDQQNFEEENGEKFGFGFPD